MATRNRTDKFVEFRRYLQFLANLALLFRIPLLISLPIFFIQNAFPFTYLMLIAVLTPFRFTFICPVHHLQCYPHTSWW